MLLNNFRSTGSVRADVFSQKRKCRFRLFTTARITNECTRNVREKSLRATRFPISMITPGNPATTTVKRRRRRLRKLFSSFVVPPRKPFGTHLFYTYVRVFRRVHCIARFLKSRQKTNLVLPSKDVATTCCFDTQKTRNAGIRERPGRHHPIPL